MAQSQHLLPPSFNSSSLVRLLASLDVAPAADPTPNFAEKLSDWVAWTDAISLSSALGSGAKAVADDMPVAPSAPVASVVTQLQRLREELTESITNDTILSGVNWGRARPAAAATGEADTGHASEFDFAAYRRSFSAQQRTMEERIGALRVAVRGVATGHSAALGQLAALDAAMDTALGVHQRRVMANVPAMLEKRFKAVHRPIEASPSRQGDAPASVPGKPPAAYGKTLQGVLLAEMEVRLQPVEGMIEALGSRFTG